MEQRTKTINGISFWTNGQGVILWCDDWCGLGAMAWKRQNGLGYRSYGPSTFGHVDFIFEAEAK